jgi:hypothetical protein
VKTYYCYVVPEDSGLGGGRVFVEYEGSVATRQAECYDGKWYRASDPETYHPELGPGLTDQPSTELLASGGHEIGNKEFEDAWRAAAGDGASAAE